MTVKTAISLDDVLLERVDALARETGLSRSRLFALAMYRYLERYENQRLLETLNEVYGGLPGEDDQALRTAHRSQHRRQVEDTW
jgi:predicted DNA-binding protein